jgi:hypothetical protein
LASDSTSSSPGGCGIAMKAGVGSGCDRNKFPKNRPRFGGGAAIDGNPASRPAARQAATMTAVVRPPGQTGMRDVAAWADWGSGADIDFRDGETIGHRRLPGVSAPPKVRNRSSNGGPPDCVRLPPPHRRCFLTDRAKPHAPPSASGDGVAFRRVAETLRRSSTRCPRRPGRQPRLARHSRRCQGRGR